MPAAAIHLFRPIGDPRLSLGQAPCISIDAPTRVLNGPSSLGFSVPAAYARSNGEDGRPILQEYGTLAVYEGRDGTLVAGIVDALVPEGETVKVAAGGFTALAVGVPWEGASKDYYEADPLAIFKEVWAHLQSYSNSNLRIEYTGDRASSGSLGVKASRAYTSAQATYEAAKNAVSRTEQDVKDATAARDKLLKKVFADAGLNFLGKIVKRTTAPTTDKAKVIWLNVASGGPVISAWTAKDEKADKVLAAKREAAYDAAKERADEAIRTGASNAQALQDLADQAKADWQAIESTLGWRIKSAASATYVEYQAALTWLANEKKVLTPLKTKRTAAKDAFEKLSDQGPAPYQINWFATTDLGATLTELREAGGFEIRETARWDGNAPVLGLEIRAGWLGTVRDTLRFEVGVNVPEAPAVETSDVYTEVRAFGAGEGSKQLRKSLTWDGEGRVRRVKVLSNKDWKSSQVVHNKAASELARIQAQAAVTIDSLIVDEHPNAPLSAFGVGDVITVCGPMPGGWDLDVAVRVLEMTLDDAGTRATLRVEMST